jgi:ribosomal protein S18 acetylase RimI-like enzyme
MNNIFIRESKESDFQELMNIDNMVFNNSNTPALTYWQSVEDYSKHYSPGNIFVALINDKVAGYIGYHSSTRLKSNCHVMEIYIAVHPDFQKKGVGGELLNYISSWGKQNGFKKISLRVLSTNKSAIPFYISNGFKEQGRLIDEFLLDGKFVDDILMYKML